MTEPLGASPALDTRPAGAGPAHARTRVAHVIPSLRLGGLEGVVVRLTRHLGGDYEQMILTPGPSGPLREQLAPDTRVVALGDRHRPDYRNALRMAAAFRAFRPDIVHTRNWTCIDAVLGARLARVPTVVHSEHGREASDPEGRNPLRRRVRRLLAPLVDQFMTVSQDLARWLVEDVGVRAAKVRVIRNGVDTDRFRPGDRQAARRALGLGPEAIVIGTVSRLDPVKDHVGLVRAFAEAASGHPEAVLAIVGEGPTRPAIDAAAAELALGPRLRRLGARDDVALLLRGFDLFVLPSLGEGISNSLLEAMATGLPALATRVGGNPELVQDGVTGTLVPAGSVAALAAALARYLDDPSLRRRHGAAARLHTERHLSQARMLADYDALYRGWSGRRGHR